MRRTRTGFSFRAVIRGRSKGRSTGRAHSCRSHGSACRRAIQACPSLTLRPVSRSDAFRSRRRRLSVTPGTGDDAIGDDDTSGARTMNHQSIIEFDAMLRELGEVYVYLAEYRITHSYL